MAGIFLNAETLPAYPNDHRAPNVVLIMADDLGWKDLNCYGNASVDTPALNRLAGQ
ncbi:MAG: sulfatase-like hydrolase/transferase, partial [Mariniblastus sp.]|nr:sulfatase-like hydrolase/transferase [Mariniblastus sp.]